MVVKKNALRELVRRSSTSGWMSPQGPLDSMTLDTRLERLRAPWDAVNDAARKAYSVNSYENVTEFTGIVLYVAPYRVSRVPSENPITSTTPLVALKSASKKYSLKCYIIDGPQSIMMPIPTSFSKIRPDTNLERMFMSYPEFIYDMSRVCGLDPVPVVGDLVKLKFNNSSYTTGICIKHLRENHFEILYSLDEEESKIDKFDEAPNINDVGDFNEIPLDRASPPKWDKPCLNDQDPKFLAGSLRTTAGMKKLIRGWAQRADVPYDYNKPKGWRKGLLSYDDITKVPAIGWGHLIKNSERTQYPVRVPISRIVARTLFNDDIRAKEKRLARLIKVPITQNQFDAMASFYFDMGISFLRGKDSIVEELNAGNCAAAAKAFLQFGPRSRGEGKEIFIKRRKYEASLFVSPYRGLPIVPPESPIDRSVRALKRSEVFGVSSTDPSTISFWTTKSGGLK